MGFGALYTKLMIRNTPKIWQLFRPLYYSVQSNRNGLNETTPEALDD